MFRSSSNAQKPMKHPPGVSSSASVDSLSLSGDDYSCSFLDVSEMSSFSGDSASGESTDISSPIFDCFFLMWVTWSMITTWHSSSIVVKC